MCNTNTAKNGQSPVFPHDKICLWCTRLSLALLLMSWQTWFYWLNLIFDAQIWNDRRVNIHKPCYSDAMFAYRPKFITNIIWDTMKVQLWRLIGTQFIRGSREYWCMAGTESCICNFIQSCMWWDTDRLEIRWGRGWKKKCSSSNLFVVLPSKQTQSY